jgi:hypothetical protein
MLRSVRLLALLVMLSCAPVSVAAADPYPVMNTADAGGGSLRAAILAANAHPGADTIPIQATGTISLQSPLQVIFDNVSIIGPGAGALTVRRSSGDGFRILHFTSDASSVSGLTVSNGRIDFGAGILNTFGSLVVTGVVVRGNEAVVEGGTVATAEGAGIHSEGPLTLRESVVSGNLARALDGSTETVALGGGIAAFGALTVERSTISGNLAEATNGGVARARGGGLVAGDEVTIALSTISGNQARAAEGVTTTMADGGGLEVFEATLTGSTVTGNSVESGDEAFGANIDAFFKTVVRNTIVAEPVGATNCNGFQIASDGFNLDEDGSCGFEQATDLNGVVAGLGPLAANGGPTPTHALLAGSAAIDRGKSFGSAIDQRGLPRPSDFATISNAEGGDGADIGAFELQVPAAPAPSRVVVTTAPADRQPPNTRIVFAPPRLTYKRLAKFRFASTEPQSSFQCKLDKRRWRGCRNPYKRKVSAGEKHVFKVRAIDRFGNVDRTPARFGWRVKAIED